ncbi:MAG: hypothetical protein JWL77_1815 [Chthonomonadaceae bacterium]|nr:hypothetical protein [Chthonomonadaceae bacterium]
METVCMCSESNSEPSILGSIVANFGKMPIKCRFPTSKTDTKTTMQIEFVKPAHYKFRIQSSKFFRGIAIWATKITSIRKCYRNLPRSRSP